MSKKLSPDKLKRLLDFAYNAYQENNETGQAMRHGGKIPYLIHPLWGASLLITDPLIPFEERLLGFEILIVHDVLEDTSLGLPDWVNSKTKGFVDRLSYVEWEDFVKRAKKEIPFMKLLILIDKLESMYELGVSDWKRESWKQLCRDLLKDVKAHYGNIRIVQIAKPIIENTDW